MTEPRPSDPVDILVRSIGRGQEPSSAEIESVRQVLKLWLSRRGLDPGDREEVISDAIYRLIAVARRGGLDPSRQPGAWMRVVADHLAIDALRRRGRAGGVQFDERRHAAGSEDDRLAALLDRSAAAADVRDALQQTAQAGQYETARVIATWLGLAAANGEAPSTREVGERLGISHMTVQRALRAFGDHLASGRDVPGRSAGS